MTRPKDALASAHDDGVTPTQAPGKGTAGAHTLTRKTFTISRLAEFASKSELTKQIGHAVEDWPLYVAKELIDNGLDAAEEAGAPPEIEVSVDHQGITVEDRGPGIPPETVEKLVDYSARTSSRIGYIGPTRGAQGNALQTIIAMPFALAGRDGETVVIESRGVEQRIVFATDPVRQIPRVEIARDASQVKTGTRARVLWPDSASSILDTARRDFLQLVETFTWFNPHLSLSLTWNGEPCLAAPPTAPEWTKWLPSAPTSAHWYNAEIFQRLIGAEVAFAEDHGSSPRPVREFVAEFRGLSATAKTKAICDRLGLARRTLADLVKEASLVARLLAQMKEASRPVKPKDLGVIGRDHLFRRFAAAGAEEDTFDYRMGAFERDGLPYVVEIAFAYAPGLTAAAAEEEALSGREAAVAEIECRRKGRDRVRRMITGLNFSAAVGANPFRELRDRQGLDGLLSRQFAGADEPVIVFVHLTTPRLSFLDKGKSSVTLP